MTNTNPTTGIRYGVIAFNNLDPDLGQELWYTHGEDLSYEAACEELLAEIERNADNIEDEVRIAIAEEDPSLVGQEGFEDARIEAAYMVGGYDDREDYIQSRYDRERERVQIDEPVIEGEYAGVKYRIDWLGGAPLLWVLEGPVGRCHSLCSPCIPNAGDLDSGFIDDEMEAGYECYVVPFEWLSREVEPIPWADSEGGEA